MNLELFIKFISVTLQKQITYRFDYFMGITNGFLYVFIFTSLWRALYSQTQIQSHSGFTLTAIITYAVMAMAVRIAFSMDDSAIYKRVQDGSVSMDLIRPVSFFLMNLSQSIGYSLFHTMARTMPIVVISVFLFDISIPFDPIRFIAFLLSAVMGYLILFMINFSVGLLAFWFVEIFPFMLLKYGFFTLFSGAIVPIDFFPGFLKVMAEILPFQYILYTPTVILMGRADMTAVPEMMAGQAVWLILMLLISRMMWIAGRSKLIVQGG